MKFVSKLIFLFPLFSFAKIENQFVQIEQGIQLLNISQENVKIKKNEIYLQSFHRNKPVVIEFTKDFSGADCSINESTKCFAGLKINLSTIDLNKPTKKISFKNKNILIHQIPENFPQLKITGQSQRPEDFVFSWSPKKIDSNKEKEYSYLFVYSPKGQLKYFQFLPFIAVDFKSHFIGKKLFFSFLKSSAVYPLVTIEGKRILFDDQMNLIKEFPQLLDFHEFQLISKDWFLAIVYEINQNIFGTKYLQQKIIEFKNNKKIFEWSVDEFMKTNPFPNWKMISNFRNQSVVHQFHLNHLQVVGDQLLVSLGFECVLLLDKKTKKIIWVFGGGSDQFGLTNELSTSLHHTPIFNSQNSTLTFFDNGIAKRSTRVTQYQLDIPNKKIIKFKQINTPAAFSAMMGSVTEFEQNYTVGYGTREFGEFDIIEVDNNKIVMTFRFDSPESSTYKIYRSMTKF